MADEIPSLWPDFKDILPSDERLAEIREQHQQKKVLQEEARQRLAAVAEKAKLIPGVVYVKEVCSFDPDYPALRITVESEERRVELTNGVPSITPDTELLEYYLGKDETPPIAHVLGDVPCFFAVVPAPHADLDEVGEHIEIHGRLFYADDNEPPRWNHVHTIEPSPNKKYEADNPFTKRAVTLAENWIKQQLEREHEEDDDEEEAFPLPVKAVYRLVHVVKTRKLAGENEGVPSATDQPSGSEQPS